MIEIEGHIWDLSKRESWSDNKAIVVTTNAMIKKDGTAVMGRGIALEAATRYLALPRMLAYHLELRGNVPCLFSFYEHVLITFPTKWDWRDASDPALIKQSAIKLVELVNEQNYLDEIYMPRVGCGNGGLDWEDVKPLLEDLDNRFHVVTLGGSL